MRIFGGAWLLAVALTAGIAVARAEEQSAPQTDGEVWNDGVEFYRQGDVTNALRVLRPLMLSKSHGPRAAEVVAKLEYDAGNLEEAAVAAQLALRAAPEDARANRNFTRAIDRLPEQRERKRVEDVLKAAQGKDPGAMLQGAVREARTLMNEAAGYRTNAAERVVALADSLSGRAERLSDVWLPLRQLIAQSVTNEEQAATIMTQVDSAQAKTRQAAEQLADLEAEAYSSLAEVEQDCNRFFKMTVLPPAAMEEGLVAQSNAWQDVEKVNGREWQPEALDFTRAFRAKFPAWARAYEQQAQADTNKPPFTAEDQAKVSALATELEKIQMECCEKQLPPMQEKALGVIRQIQELLPKDKNGGQGQQNQQPNQNQQNQQQDQQQNQQQNQDQQKQDQQKQDQQQEQSQQPEPQKDEKKDEKKEEKSKAEQQQEQELDATLKKAQERSDEHEAEKKARMRKAPLPPNERDW